MKGREGERKNSRSSKDVGFALTGLIEWKLAFEAS